MNPNSTTPLTPFGKLLITTFGLGFMRSASGTWGSMPSAGLAWVLILLGCTPSTPGVNAIIYYGALGVVFLIFCAACVVFGKSAEVTFGKKDPGQVVADETAGQCIALLALPAAATTGFWHATITVGIAFVAFRVFDILKLPPAYKLQRFTGGWGILLDDLVAGVQALVVVQLVTRLALPHVPLPA